MNREQASYEAGLKAALEVVENYSQGASRRLEETKAERDRDPERLRLGFGTQCYFEGKVDALTDLIGSLNLALKDDEEKT